MSEVYAHRNEGEAPTAPYARAVIKLIGACSCLFFHQRPLRLLLL